MTQFNFGTIVASTKSGSGLAADLNAWRDAMHTQHKGPARPTYAVAGLGWLNDTDAPWEDYVFDGTQDALRGFIDPVNHRYSSAGNFARTIPSGGATARLADWGTLFNMGGIAAQTVAIDPKDTLLPGWWIRVIASTVTVTINPYGTELIDGVATILLSAGSSVTIFYDGVNFYSDANGGGASAFPVGGIVHVPSAAPPAGFIRLNGALLSRATYAALWGFAQASANLVATDATWEEGKFSPGDGTTNFRIPDGRGSFIRSWDDSRGIDVSRGLGTAQADEMRSHGHGITINGAGDHSHSFSAVTDQQGSHQHIGLLIDGSNSDTSEAGPYISANNSGHIAGLQNSAQSRTAFGGTHAHNVSGGTSAGGNHTHSASITGAGGAETRPRNVALLACIKY